MHETQAPFRSSWSDSPRVSRYFTVAEAVSRVRGRIFGPGHLALVRITDETAPGLDDTSRS